MSLSLNALKTATGVANATLATCAGTTTGPIKMSEFKVDAVSSISGNEIPAFGDFETYTLNMSGRGSRFLSRIGTIASNFTWTESNPTVVYGNNYNGYAVEYEMADHGNCTLSAKLHDGFNTGATGYNTNQNLAIMVE